MRKCPRCGVGQLTQDTTSGEIFCTGCGYVADDRLVSLEPEWRGTERGGESKSRAGRPMSPLRGFDLTTEIGKRGVDASGRGIDPKLKAAVKRMQLWDNRSSVHGPIDRNIRRASIEIEKLIQKLSARTVHDRAEQIYKVALERGIVKGRSIDAIVAASVLAACRDMKVPRTLKDVAAATSLTKKEVSRCYRLLLKELEMTMPIVKPESCVSKIASRIQLSERAQRRAYKVLAEADRRGLTAGKDPMGLAAAALYRACLLEGETRTQKKIAEAAGVTEVTIRNRYKGIGDIE